jgi:CRP/FNR family cyclic AMP-dependent transcriptional regulator
MTNERRIKLLQSIPFFGAMNDSSVSLMLELSKTLTKKPNELFFHEDEPGDSLFILEKGHVSIFRTHKGKEYLIREIQEGDCFGDMALIDLTTRGASVRAITECTAIEIPCTAMASLYEHDPEQYLILQMNLAREMTRRLRSSYERWFQLQIEHDENKPKTT